MEAMRHEQVRVQKIGQVPTICSNRQSQKLMPVQLFENKELKSS